MEMKESLELHVLSGSTTDPTSVDSTALRTVRLLGQIAGINMILNAFETNQE
jgi:hypothetical protein